MLFAPILHSFCPGVNDSTVTMNRAHIGPNSDLITHSGRPNDFSRIAHMSKESRSITVEPLDNLLLSHKGPFINSLKSVEYDSVPSSLSPEWPFRRDFMVFVNETIPPNQLFSELPSNCHISL